MPWISPSLLHTYYQYLRFYLKKRKVGQRISILEAPCPEVTCLLPQSKSSNTLDESGSNGRTKRVVSRRSGYWLLPSFFYSSGRKKTFTLYGLNSTDLKSSISELQALQAFEVLHSFLSHFYERGSLGRSDRRDSLIQQESFVLFLALAGFLPLLS